MSSTVMSFLDQESSLVTRVYAHISVHYDIESGYFCVTCSDADQQ